MESLTLIRPTTDFARVRRDELPDTYPPGRRCPHEQDDGSQCITVLCKWNGSAWCYVHRGRHEREMRAILDLDED